MYNLTFAPPSPSRGGPRNQLREENSKFIRKGRGEKKKGKDGKERKRGKKEKKRGKEEKIKDKESKKLVKKFRLRHTLEIY